MCIDNIHETTTFTLLEKLKYFPEYNRNNLKNFKGSEMRRISAYLSTIILSLHESYIVIHVEFSVPEENIPCLQNYNVENSTF